MSLSMESHIKWVCGKPTEDQEKGFVFWIIGNSEIVQSILFYFILFFFIDSKNSISL